jgi:glycosyltransferase involved in cell wall biosynthesis
VTDSRPGIVQLIDSLDAGGAERVAVDLANHLPRDRFRPLLCATRRGGPLEAQVADDVERLVLGRRGRFDPRAILRLARWLRRHRVAIVHAHSSSLFLGLVASRLAGLGRRRPKVVWHDHYGADAPRPVRLFRPAVRRAAAVVAVSEPLAAWSRDRLGVPAERVLYLPNFTPVTPVTPTTPTTSTTPAVAPDLPGETRSRVVAVANLRPQKDHPTLIDAWARVAAQLPRAHLLLVGTGSDPEWEAGLRRRMDEAGLADRITFLGHRPDVPAVLAASAVGVLSSTSEGLPLALLEYGAAGLAAVATRVGQCAEVLDEGEAGLLVPPGDPTALAGALLALLPDPDRRRHLGERLRERVRASYNADVTLETLTALYRSLLP